ncbi:MAG: hypothetical protein U0841_32710 [Chloroflexia bacterium]
MRVDGAAELLQPGEAGHGAAIAALRAKYAQYGAMALEERPGDPDRAEGGAVVGALDATDEGEVLVVVDGVRRWSRRGGRCGTSDPIRCRARWWRR